MEKEITDLFREKEFHELNDQERDQLGELCESEEEFEQMRNLFIGMEVMKNERFVPKEETKKSLDSIFAEKHSAKNRVIWYNSVLVALYPTDKPIQRRPLVQIAAVIAVIALTIPFLTNKNLTEPSNTLAKLENTEKNVQDKTKVSADNKVLEKAEAVEKPSMRSESTVTFTENFSQELPIEASIAEDLKSESDMMTGAAAPVVAAESVSVAFNHPDGIFEGANADVSRSVKQQPKILDLLTAAF